SAVSGTSVGGLNASLFLQGDYERAEEAWRSISNAKILARKGDGRKIREKYADIRRTRGFHFKGREGLMEIIQESLDMDVFDRSEMNCYVACYRTGEAKEKDRYLECMTGQSGGFPPASSGKMAYFNIRDFPKKDRMLLLLATSAIPFVYPQERIGGYYYMDGRAMTVKGSDNHPVFPLYEKERCDFIISLSLYADKLPFDPSKFPDARILEIRPRKELEAAMDFSPALAARRIEDGYRDAMASFRKDEEMMGWLQTDMGLTGRVAEKETRFLQESFAGKREIENRLCELEKG
ncbi:MAG: patatin-like phospholipase family protein, partial [Lachnospiraceae bacterium]|nr:patatin-like phospholipase family protein [Lachnospiraceae bacterium]